MRRRYFRASQPNERNRRAVIRAMMAEIPTPTAGDVRGMVGFSAREFNDLTLIARSLNNDKRRGHHDGRNEQ